MKTIREDDILHVIVTGDNTPEDVRGYLRQLDELCTQQRCARVLIEEDLTGPSFGTVDLFETVCAASTGVAPTIRRIAFVDTNPEHSFANLSFGETVAVNRGVRVKVFRDVRSATEWIRQ